MTVRRRMFAVRTDNPEVDKPRPRTVSLTVDGKPARGLLHLDAEELRRLVYVVTTAAGDHPQADYVVGPDARLWCPVCAEGGRRDECEGAGCPGDNPLAVARRAAETLDERAGVVADEDEASTA